MLLKGSDIFAGFLIACVLLILFYKYLSWGNDHIDTKELYDKLPSAVSPEDKNFLETYGSLLPNRLMVDSYKMLNYLRIYYLSGV
jgi:hypothetical protein